MDAHFDVQLEARAISTGHGITCGWHDDLTYRLLYDTAGATFNTVCWLEHHAHGRGAGPRERDSPVSKLLMEVANAAIKARPSTLLLDFVNILGRL